LPVGGRAVQECFLTNQAVMHLRGPPRLPTFLLEDRARPPDLGRPPCRPWTHVPAGVEPARRRASRRARGSGGSASGSPLRPATPLHALLSPALPPLFSPAALALPTIETPPEGACCQSRSTNRLGTRARSRSHRSPTRAVTPVVLLEDPEVLPPTVRSP
jgi:hypothetical protein